MKVETNGQGLTITSGFNTLFVELSEISLLIAELGFAQNELQRAGNAGAWGQLDAIMNLAELWDVKECGSLENPVMYKNGEDSELENVAILNNDAASFESEYLYISELDEEQAAAILIDPVFVKWVSDNNLIP